MFSVVFHLIRQKAEGFKGITLFAAIIHLLLAFYLFASPLNGLKLYEIDAFNS